MYSIPAGTTLRPLRDQVVVRVEDLKLSDTIIANWSGKPVQGTVVAVGPGHYPKIHRRGTHDGRDFHEVSESKHFQPTELKPGDRVQFGGMEIGGYLFPQIGIDGHAHVLCQEADICVVENG